MPRPRSAPTPSPRRPWWRRLLVIAAGAVTGLALLLYVVQDSLIYFPRRYRGDVIAQPPPDCVALRFRTGQGDQVAFWRPPAGPAQRLWLCFGGNAALALHWRSVIEGYDDGGAGFLFVEYPGYGACAGAPSPAAIAENAEAALAALAAHLGESPAALVARSGVLGHSLGSGAALRFAASHDVRAAVLVSPFTSLRDMAQRTVGWPLCWLLKANFDNRARLAELCARERPPALAILHGSADEIIPVAMGRALAEQAGARLRYDEVAGADHNGIVVTARDRLWAAMRTALPATP